MPLQQGRDQQAEVSLSFAQRRQLEREALQAREQVGAEGAGLDHRRQRAVGGADHAQVDRHGLGAADRQHHPLGEHAKQRGLGGQRELAHLVQEERAAVRRAHQARRVVVGAREGALLVAEELGLEQGRSDGGAVDGHQRALAARAGVQGVGGELLAGARFAGHQHRELRGRDGLELGEHFGI